MEISLNVVVLRGDGERVGTEMLAESKGKTPCTDSRIPRQRTYV